MKYSVTIPVIFVIDFEFYGAWCAFYDNVYLFRILDLGLSTLFSGGKIGSD